MAVAELSVTCPTTVGIAAGALAEKWLRQEFGTEVVCWVSSVMDLDLPAEVSRRLEADPPTRAEIDALEMALDGAAQLWGLGELQTVQTARAAQAAQMVRAAQMELPKRRRVGHRPSRRRSRRSTLADQGQGGANRMPMK